MKPSPTKTNNDTQSSAMPWISLLQILLLSSPPTLSSSFHKLDNSTYLVLFERRQQEKCATTIQTTENIAINPYVMYASIGDGSKHSLV